MAQVFLSYDREDGAKARVIAQALERAGHFVWFDLHIKGGAEYGREIERALEQSDAVVVLWSERSVLSAWVRDEAAAGRDKGRLIPVLLEPVSPPMGFRQYQNLDFSSWKGRGKPPHMAELLASIEALVVPSPTEPQPAGPAVHQTPPPKRLLHKWLMIGGLAMLVLVAVGLFVGLVLNDRRDADRVHAVAVTSADTAAAPLARDLLVKLSILQGARSGSLRLLGDKGSAPEADLIFETASSSDDNQVGANLVLLAGKDREILWSKDFEQPSGKTADLKQQMAFTAARVLGCTLEGLTDQSGSLDRQTLKLYLNACAQHSEQAEPASLIKAFAQVTEKAPRFAPAWAGLLLAQADIAQQGNTGNFSDPASLRTLRKSIAAARKYHPQLPEAKIAEITLQPANDFVGGMRLLDEAKAMSPHNLDVLSSRANGLLWVGRMRESIEEAKRASNLDPLSPYALNAYISSLAYAGRTDAAREQLALAERLWPGTAMIIDIRYRFHLRYGDPKIAWSLNHLFGGREGTELFLKARADPSAANIEALRIYAVTHTTNDPAVLSFTTQALGEFDLNEDLYRIVLAWRDDETLAEIGDNWFRPALAGFRRDPRFMLVMKRTGVLEYWQASGKWPDFCFEPDLPYDCKAEAAKLAGRPN